MLEDLFKMVKDRFNEEQKDVADSSAPEIPKDLLFKCPRCQNVFYMDEFEKRKKTCPVCNYHARLSAKERLDITVDKDSFKPFDENMVSLNPIGFPDYEKKIKGYAGKHGTEGRSSDGRMHYTRLPCGHRHYGFQFYDGEHGQCCR